MRRMAAFLALCFFGLVVWVFIGALTMEEKPSPTLPARSAEVCFAMYKEPIMRGACVNGTLQNPNYPNR